MAVRKKIDILFDIPLLIVRDGSFSVFTYNSFSRGFHVYKDKWQPTVGDDSLHCEEEKDDKYDKHAVPIIYDSFHSNKVVGHIQFYWSECTNHHIRVVTGKRMNRGIGISLENPVGYFFHGDIRVIEWFKNSIEKLDKCTDVKVEKCTK